MDPRHGFRNGGLTTSWVSHRALPLKTTCFKLKQTEEILRVGFWQNGFFADFYFWAAGFFRGFSRRIFFLIFVGKSAQKKSSRKIPTKIFQILYNKNPPTHFCRMAGAKIQKARRSKEHIDQFRRLLVAPLPSVLMRRPGSGSRAWFRQEKGSASRKRCAFETRKRCDFFRFQQKKNRCDFFWRFSGAISAISAAKPAILHFFAIWKRGDFSVIAIFGGAKEKGSVEPNVRLLGNWPNTVSESTVSNTELSEFFGATEFRGANSASSFQPIICVQKRTHRVFRRTHRVSPKTQWGSVSSLLRNSQYSARFLVTRVRLQPVLLS